MTSKLINFARS